MNHGDREYLICEKHRFYAYDEAIPCSQCQIDQLRDENASLKAELAKAKKDAMCWYMTKQWHHADTIARIEESAKQATKGK